MQVVSMSVQVLRPSYSAFVAAVIKTIELGGLGSHGDFTCMRLEG